METKVCKRCGKEKEIQFFDTSLVTKNGYAAHCQDCEIFRTSQINVTIPPKEELEKLALTMNSTEIAFYYGCCPNTATKWLDKYQIPRKQRRKKKKYNQIIDEELIIKLYLIDKLSPNDIVEQYNYDRNKIRKVLYKNGVQVREIKDALKCGPGYGGYKEISQKYWNVAKKGAVIRNLEFNITIEFAWELFLKQNRKCALTGIDLVMYKTNDEKAQTASLDRINSKLGYTENNVQWLHKHVNVMKMHYSQEYFIDLCKKVVAYNA